MLWNTEAALFTLTILTAHVGQVSSKFTFSNIECIADDKDYFEFDYCFIKSINRTYQYVELKLVLKRKPLTQIQGKFAVLRRASYYKPFLYNITINACTFLKAQKRDPLQYFVYTLFTEHSNLNTSCPINTDIIVSKLAGAEVLSELTKVIPLPNGDYKFHSNWYSGRKLRFSVYVYGKIFRF